MPPTSYSRRGNGSRPLIALAALAALLAALTAGGCSRKPKPERAERMTKVSVSRGDRPGRAARADRPAPKPAADGGGTEPISATDACATQMHELLGALLLYSSQNRKLPESLEDLQAGGAGAGPVALECPVSGGAYVYVPEGMPRGGGQPGFIVIHDPAPSHSGYRWAIVFEETGGDRALAPKVVAVPEARFAGADRGGGHGGQPEP